METGHCICGVVVFNGSLVYGIQKILYLNNYFVVSKLLVDENIS